MRILLLIISVVIAVAAHAQKTDTVYTQEYLTKSTKFAWLTYGGDINFLGGGTTQQLRNGALQNTPFGAAFTPRLTIGGIHFWGYADFYVSFPLSFLSYQDIPDGLDDLEVYQGVETGVRVYPFPVEPQSLRPFVGISFRRLRFSQESEESDFNNGVPNYGRFTNPVQFGLTYTSDSWHLSLSGYYNFQNEFNYAITPTENAQVNLDPLSLNISLLRYIDTDQSLRNPRSVKKINENYQLLKQKNRLSAWFFGIGPSSALQVSKSPFLKEYYPYFHDNYSAAILPDFSLGRYFDKPDMNVGLTYRTYGEQYKGFDSKIDLWRHSAGVESVKFLFNWLGFVPFVGAAITYENLSATVDGIDYQEDKAALGFVFGWDIRVTKTGTGLLRTNLRYFPDLHMNIEGEKMMFDHLEFNFIQWVQFIGRKKALKGI